MRAVMLALAACCAAWAAPPEPARWRLVFSGEFEGAAPGTAKWNYRTGPRMWSEQRPENVPVSGGMPRRYYLYYMGNTGDDQAMKMLNRTRRNNQRIGAAAAGSPYDPRQRLDRPLVDVSAHHDAPDALLASNPAVAGRPGSGCQLACKAAARKRPMPFGEPVLHLTATADSATGRFTGPVKPIFTAPGIDFPAEDPFVWHDYGAGPSLALREPENGLDWKLSAYPLVSPVGIPWEGGQRQKLNSLQRPRLLFGPDGGRKARWPPSTRRERGRTPATCKFS